MYLGHKRESAEQPRPERFDLPVPVKFRERGQTEWHFGVVKNISASGALIEGGDRVAVGAEIEVWLLMRAYRGDLANVVCPSVVVRCEAKDEAEPLFGSAMKFRSYKFCPSGS